MEKLREGDFVETSEGLIFHVKGVLHPSDSVIAFLRYVPSDSGERRKGGRTYEKIYPIEDRFDYLRKNFPHYIQYSERMKKKIQLVELEYIEKVYKPENKLKELREKQDLSGIEEDVVKFANSLIEFGIEPDCLGVTGSILVDLPHQNSDIDMIGYGKEKGWKIYSAIKELKSQNSPIKPYDRENALRIAKFRWSKTGIPLDVLADIERRKVLHGMFKDRDFFMRLVKNPDEIEGRYKDFSFTPKGKTKIRGIVKKDRDSIFTPNHYHLKNTVTQDRKISEIKKATSYRGRFTEQAEEKEEIIAYGRLEKVKQKKREYHRILLGQPEEYLMPLKNKKEVEII